MRVVRLTVTVGGTFKPVVGGANSRRGWFHNRRYKIRTGIHARNGVSKGDGVKVGSILVPDVACVNSTTVSCAYQTGVLSNVMGYHR